MLAGQTKRRGATGQQDGGPDPETTRTECVNRIVQDLRVVFRTVQGHSRWVEKQCGVSGAQLWALWEMFAAPGLKVSELSEALAIHRSTASNLLDKLESKALIRRERGGPDQRVVRLYLTPQGADLLARAPHPAQGALRHALFELPDSTLVALQSALDQLADAMAAPDTDAALHPLSEN